MSTRRYGTTSKGGRKNFFILKLRPDDGLGGGMDPLCKRGQIVAMPTTGKQTVSIQGHEVHLVNHLDIVWYQTGEDSVIRQ